LAFIITEPCVGLCDAACIDCCPVDCIHFTKTDMGETVREDGFDPKGKQLFIDPVECIDCGACEPECPVEAIFEEEDVPVKWKKYIKMNYDHFGHEMENK